MREFIDRQRERRCLIRRGPGIANHKLAIFIHGFRGNHLATWGSLSTFLSENADDDGDLASWDYLFLGYSTNNIDTYLDIAALICTAWQQALDGAPPHLAKYSKIALFGHSLGTLGIRQILCDSTNHRNGLIATLHSTTLFGTPINGSRLALLGVPLHSVAHALKPNNPQLRMLKIWSENSFLQNQWKPVRVVLGQGDWVVGYQASQMIDWPGDLTPHAQITANHRDLSKPDSFQNCSVMDYIRTGLR